MMMMMISEIILDVEETLNDENVCNARYYSDSTLLKSKNLMSNCGVDPCQDSQVKVIHVSSSPQRHIAAGFLIEMSTKHVSELNSFHENPNKVYYPDSLLGIY